MRGAIMRYELFPVPRAVVVASVVMCLIGCSPDTEGLSGVRDDEAAPVLVRISWSPNAAEAALAALPKNKVSYVLVASPDEVPRDWQAASGVSKKLGYRFYTSGSVTIEPVYSWILTSVPAYLCAAAGVFDFAERAVTETTELYFASSRCVSVAKHPLGPEHFVDVFIDSSATESAFLIEEN